MTDEEKAFRLTALTELFSGHGISDKGRLRYYANKTAYIPASVFRSAVDRAAQSNSSGFPPSVGQICKAALDVWPRERSLATGDLSTPRWHIAAHSSKRREGRMLGAGNSPHALSGLVGEAMGALDPEEES